MKRSSKKRATELVPALERRLTMYTLTAAAAGIGMSFAARPAEAEIVYTPRNLTYVNQSFHIDVNNDGMNDFVVQFRYGNTDHYLSAAGVKSNGVVSGGQQNIRGVERAVAAALAAGAVIGDADTFVRAPQVMAALYYGSDGGSTVRYGNLTNKGIVYLGLKFQIQGQPHFGWARLSVSVPFGSGNGMYPPINVQLTGYAYETIAGKSIVAGKTSGSDVPDALYLAPAAARQAGLGVLALGTPGLAAWRRRESANATV